MSSVVRGRLCFVRGVVAAFAELSYAAIITTAAVPEPTSGMLLLLGVAGLALRRRAPLARRGRDMV